MTRKFFLVALCLCWTMAQSMAQEPDWVKKHPVGTDLYYGVGFAPMSDSDYIAMATHSALADIAGQIASKVESRSFLQTIDADGHSRELFEEKISHTVAGYLEGQCLSDSWSDGTRYYVLYSIDKGRYAESMEGHRRSAINAGLDYYRRGTEMLGLNSLAAAAQFFAKGLQAVEPWTFTDLSTSVNGQPFDVAGELYRAFVSVFDGLSITVSETNVNGELFKPVGKPIAACLSRDGVVVPNVKLAAAFIKGSGEVTLPVATDYTGTSEFYVTNITSRDIVQEIRITIDMSFLSSLPEAYLSLLPAQSWPEAKVVIQLSDQAVTACIHVSEDVLPGCSSQVASLLANNHFSLSESPDDARVFIEMTTGLSMAGTVPGELYDLNECHVSISLKFYDMISRQLLLDYNVSGLRVLAPKTWSAAQVKALCTRELSKRVRSELPKELKTIKL